MQVTRHYENATILRSYPRSIRAINVLGMHMRQGGQATSHEVLELSNGNQKGRSQSSQRAAPFSTPLREAMSIPQTRHCRTTHRHPECSQPRLRTPTNVLNVIPTIYNQPQEAARGTSTQVEYDRKVRRASRRGQVSSSINPCNNARIPQRASSGAHSKGL